MVEWRGVDGQLFKRWSPPRERKPKFPPKRGPSEEDSEGRKAGRGNRWESKRRRKRTAAFRPHRAHPVPRSCGDTPQRASREAAKPRGRKRERGGGVSSAELHRFTQIQNHPRPDGIGFWWVIVESGLPPYWVPYRSRETGLRSELCSPRPPSLRRVAPGFFNPGCCCWLLPLLGISSNAPFSCWPASIVTSAVSTRIVTMTHAGLIVLRV
jgi:hypothetical protein